MKTKESRFHIHDELTAPEGSLPILKGALSTGGQVSNFLGVLAGSPAVLRAYARFRSELRHGELPLKSQQRIGLAVAEYQGSEYWLNTLQRTAREAGLGLDEIALARQFDSRDEREHALLKYARRWSRRPAARRRSTSTRRRARRGGPTSRSSRRSRTCRSASSAPS